MKFTNLTIENFLVVTSASVKLNDRGLLLIQGVNEQDTSASSNGAGKSSIVDALSWAIYGVTARGESGDGVINNKVGKGTRVEVGIIDDMVEYRIVRHRKHKQGKNAVHVFVNDGISGEKDITKGTDKLTQELIDKIVGASLDVFVSAIYAGQEHMPDLPSMTDKMLKVMIEEAAGISALESAYEESRKSLQAAMNDLKIATTIKDGIYMSIAAKESERDRLIKAEDSWVEENKGKIQKLTNEAKDLLSKSAAIQDKKQEISEITALIKEIDDRIKSVSDEQVKLSEFERDVVNAAANLANATKMEIIANNKLISAQKRLDGIDGSVGTPCSECGRPVTLAEISAVRATASDAVNLAANELKAARSDVVVAQDAKNRADSALLAFRGTMTNLAQEVNERSNLEAQKAVLIGIDTEREKINKLAKDLIGQIQVLKAEKSPFVKAITDIQSGIEEALSDLAIASGTLLVKQKAADLEAEVAKVFSPVGVRARILDDITPYLNSQTARYLAVLSDGAISAVWSTLTLSKSGELKERFAIDVKSTISSHTFKGLSGGEKRKVRLACALALQDLVSTRASKPIDLFIGDEIDHALDSPGLERLMSVLVDKAAERGTVMVISHNELRDMIPNVLTVTREKNGETKISETTA